MDDIKKGAKEAAKLVATAALAVLWGGSSAVALPLTLDNFDSGDGFLNPAFLTSDFYDSGGSGSGIFTDGVAAGDVLGGERDAVLTGVAGTGATFDTLMTGDLNFAVGGGMSGGTLELVYDGDDDDPLSTDFSGLDDGMGAPGVDVTDGGSNDRFSFEVVGALGGLETLDVTVTLFSHNNGGVFTSATQQLTAADGTGSFEYLFSGAGGFSSSTGFVTADFENVGAISILLVGSDGADVTLDNFEFVPFELEAGLGFVVIGGTIAGLKLRKRRLAAQKQAATAE